MTRKKKSKIKKLHVKKTSLFWLYFVFAVLFIVSSIIFAPFWVEFNADIPWENWSKYALGIIVGTLILIYVFTILLKRVKQKDLNKVVRTIMCVEFGLMIVFAACAILKGILVNNSKFKFFNTCEIVAIILWVRGVVEMICAYYHGSSTSAKYPIWFLFVNIALISIGPLLFFIGIYYSSSVDLIVSYIISGLLLFFGAFMFIYGFLSKPIKVSEAPVEKIDSNNNDVVVVDEK